MAHREEFTKLKDYFCSLLPTMTQEGWMLTSSVMGVRKFRKGEFIIREGIYCNHVSFINKGLVRMYFLVDGREKVIDFAREENYISDYYSFLTRTPATAYIQAMEDTELVDIGYHDLQMLYATIPEANIIGRIIAEKCFMMVCENNRAMMKEAIVERYNRLVDEQPWLMQRVPQYMIASYLGITPEALSRIKAKSRKRTAPEIAYVDLG